MNEKTKREKQIEWSKNYYRKKNKFYVYVYLDPRKPGEFIYDEYKFNYEPFYVGKGKGYRMNKHLSEVKCGIYKKDHKHNKIKKILEMGLFPIILKIKKNLSENNALKIEKNVIKLIGRSDNKLGPLANTTDGGDGISGYKMVDDILKKRRRVVLQIDMNGDIINEWKSVKEANYFNKISTSISDVCKKKRFSLGGYIWRYKNSYNKNLILDEIKDQKQKEHINRVNNGKHNNIEIEEYDVNGCLINEWKSMIEASRFYGISSSSISQSIRNGSKCINKLFLLKNDVHKNKKIELFKFKNFNKIILKKNKINENYISTKGKRTKQIKNNNIVKIWNSISEASKHLGIPINNISRVCHGERHTAEGFKWEFCE
jgi:hypothetical protein